MAIRGRRFAPPGKQAFRHEAFFYAGRDEFLAGIVPFIKEADAGGEPILVALDRAKIGAIEAELNGESDLVRFVDMGRLGRNPACIIPAWREFVAQHAGSGTALRGVGEPIWPGRNDAELVECHQHESLLNLAFENSGPFWLLCPYDTERLDPVVIEEARRTHPLIAEGDTSHASDVYVAPGDGPGPFDGELPAPPPEAPLLVFGLDRLGDVRRFVSDYAAGEGLSGPRTADLMLAVSELSSNSVLYGGGGGTVRVWSDGASLVCEVGDGGRLDDPLVGRERPAPERSTGRGLWLVNRLCDLVQMRSHVSGNVIRLHMSLAC